MKRHNIRKTVMASLVCVALGASAMANAKNINLETETVEVSYSDLNLATEQGLGSMHSRLKRAASKVCGAQSLSGAGSLSQLSHNKSCYQEALNDALHQVKKVL